MLNARLDYKGYEKHSRIWSGIKRSISAY